MALHRPTGIAMHTAAFACAAALGLAGAAAAQESEGDQEPPEPDAASIVDAGNDGTGVFHMNQAAAEAVNQDNILVVAAVQGAGAALADASGTQVSRVRALAPPAGNAAMGGVANNASGIVGINQSSADGVSQGNLVGLALTSGEFGLASASVTATAHAQGAFAAGLARSSSASMSDFGNAASGIVQVNQAAGTGGGQGNLAAIALAEQGFAHAEALAGTNGTGGQELAQGGAFPAPSGSVLLLDSFNGASGLVQVNQAAGGGNSQTNLLAAAFGSHAAATAVSEAGLGDLRAAAPGDGEAHEGDLDAEVAIGNSFAGFSGVAQVSQVVGFGNQTANTVSVSINRGPGL